MSEATEPELAASPGVTSTTIDLASPPFRSVRASPALASPAAPDHLFRALGFLALPVLAENFLSIIVGLNDAYLANHLPPAIQVDGTAAVGTVVYLLWFLGLFAGALGTGATAIISRAIGAKHRARAHACVGQALLLAGALGLALALTFLLAAPFIASLAGLKGQAFTLAVGYLRIIAFGAPFFIILLVSNACLRGAGDTRSPFLAMMIVNTVNVVTTWSLTFGYLHLPALGVNGIALGTAFAYFVGAAIQVSVLLAGLGKLRLRRHRLQFHPTEMKRLLRLGLPSAAENALMWGVNFFIIHVVNGLGTTAAAAHLNTIRIEALSYMTGFGFAVATSTLVGQSLGMRNPARARKVTKYGYLLAGASMSLMGLVFLLFGHTLADVMSEAPAVRDLTARCLQITGITQFAFAGAIVYSSALRGAGDMKSMLVLNLISIVGVRLTTVIIVAAFFQPSLPLIWVIFGGELTLRATLCYARFSQGKWQTVRV